jgi:hypothetical protein
MRAVRNAFPSKRFANLDRAEILMKPDTRVSGWQEKVAALIGKLFNYGDDIKAVTASAIQQWASVLAVGQNFVLLGCDGALWVPFQKEEVRRKEMIQKQEAEVKSDTFKALPLEKQSEKRSIHRRAIRDNTSLLGFLIRCSSDNLYEDFNLDFENLMCDSEINERAVCVKVKDRVRQLMAINAITEFKSELLDTRGEAAKLKLRNLEWPNLAAFGTLKSKGRTISYSENRILLSDQVVE